MSESGSWVAVSRAAGRARRARPEKLARARELRREATPAERLLWQAVRRNALGVKFRRQHPVGPFIADFYCATARLVIELDGGVHTEQVDYDDQRDRWMRARGLTILRIPNADVERALPDVLKQIQEHL